MFKYVIDKHSNVVIGSKGLTHVQLARGLESKPVSAGFIRFDSTLNSIKDEQSPMFEATTEAIIYGESISLNLKSREKEDREIIERHMEGY